MVSLKYNNDAVDSSDTFQFQETSESTDEAHPIFNFEPISLHANEADINLIKTKETSHNFLKRIEKLSSMTWSDIKKSPRDKYGFELLPFSCIHGCSWMLSDLKKAGIKKVMVFGIQNRGVSRMLGARFGKEFKVYCFDNDGDLYDHD